MRILITGSTGLIGRHLVQHLRSSSHTVIPLVRRAAQSENEISWDPANGKLDPSALENADALIHLAGRNIADKRWSDAFKRELISSRVDSTQLLAGAFAQCKSPPKIFLSASAVGFYGARGDEPLTESSAPGVGFFPDLGQQWERASEPITQFSRRCVMRLGVVLTPAGGALKQMLPPFRLGLGGRLGPGTQYMPWISLPDVLRAIEFLLTHDDCKDAFNVTAPNPVTNADFTRALARAIHRPAIFPMPAIAARLAFGELADEALLASTRVLPEKLIARGFQFHHTDIDGALRDLLST
jgi:uncharacterized protein